MFMLAHAVYGPVLGCTCAIPIFVTHSNLWAVETLQQGQIGCEIGDAFACSTPAVQHFSIAGNSYRANSKDLRKYLIPGTRCGCPQKKTQKKSPRRGLLDQAQVRTPYTPLFWDHSRTIPQGMVPDVQPLVKS